MTDLDPQQTSHRDIDAKLKAIRSRREAETRPSKGIGKWHGAEVAWRMVIDLTAGVAVGSAIGWGLDELFGSGPLFLLAFVLLGFASGVRVMLQSAKALQKKPDEAPAAQGGPGAGSDQGAEAPKDEGR